MWWHLDGLCEACSAAKGLKGQTEALEEVLDGSEAQTHKEAEKASSARIQTALLTLTLQSTDTFSCAFSHSLFTMSYISISRKAMYLKQLNFKLNSSNVAKTLLRSHKGVLKTLIYCTSLSWKPFFPPDVGATWLIKSIKIYSKTMFSSSIFLNMQSKGLKFHQIYMMLQH